ncbi:MAG TPA: hypothetical protein PKJ62_07430 [Bacteroidia bacterium]|nr:hypothetical protein [Bacteroidia bacterium]HNS11972.1 hypothetical protein [Bacteroidia bacterium]
MSRKQGHFTIFYCFLLLAFCNTEGLKASHAMGAELTYECLSSNQYRLYYSFYRDCDGIPAPPSIDVVYTSGCFPGGQISLYPIPGSPTQVSNVCPSAITTCNGGTYTGIEEWIYSEVVTLPGLCADWMFSYAECCRNSAITTVDNVTTFNLYVFSLLNNSDGDCNNSPVFVMPPVQQVCVGQQYCINNTAIDPDGDSLSYQLITPLTASGTPISYRAPYSYTQPINSSPSATFNSVTGSLCVVPNQIEVSPFAVLVSEFRNGVLIGQVERDFQIEASACNNFLPRLTGLNGGSSFSMNVCPNVPLEIFIASTDPNYSNQTFISWDTDINSAQYIRSGGNRDSLLMIWTPDISDVSGIPRCLIVRVVDDNCPYLGIANFTYCFTVLDSSHAGCVLLATPELKIPGTVIVSRSSHDGVYKFSWDNPATFTSARVFDSAGRLVQQLSFSGLQFMDLNLSGMRSGIYHVRLDGLEQWSKSVVWE